MRTVQFQLSEEYGRFLLGMVEEELQEAIEEVRQAEVERRAGFTPGVNNAAALAFAQDVLGLLRTPLARVYTILVEKCLSEAPGAPGEVEGDVIDQVIEAVAA